MSDAPDWYIPTSQKCHDCGVAVPCDARGRMLPGHECKSDDVRVQQASLAAWEEGYGFALRNYAEELVQNDVRDFGSGWAGWVRRGVIEAEIGEGDL